MSGKVFFLNLFLLKLLRICTKNQESGSFLFRRICSKCFFHYLLTWQMYTFAPTPKTPNEHKYWLSSINNIPGLNKVESSHYWLQFLFRLLVKHHFFHWGPPSASKSLPVLGWTLQTQGACARRHRGNWPAHRSTVSNWAKEAAVGEDGPTNEDCFQPPRCLLGSQRGGDGWLGCRWDSCEDILTVHHVILRVLARLTGVTGHKLWKYKWNSHNLKLRKVISDRKRCNFTWRSVHPKLFSSSRSAQTKRIGIFLN